MECDERERLSSDTLGYDKEVDVIWEKLGCNIEGIRGHVEMQLLVLIGIGLVEIKNDEVPEK